jgi:hypothetical protein
MRLSDAERERLFEALKRHAAEGRLEIEELERRVAAIDAAQSRDEAAAVMADLPALEVAGQAPPERRPRWGRGHGEMPGADPSWQPTNERFRDPRTRKVMRVWVDPATGARHYVAEE